MLAQIHFMTAYCLLDADADIIDNVSPYYGQYAYWLEITSR